MERPEINLPSPADGSELQSYQLSVDDLRRKERPAGSLYLALPP
jgi:hypothetical protein